MTDSTALHVTTADGVATLTFDNPKKRNALDMALRAQLADAWPALRADASVRAVVLTGAGGHFCSGGDLRAMADAPRDGAAWRDRMHDLHAAVRGLLTFDKPVVAAVDGAAAGAGFSLALAADFVIATPRARFCMSFLKIGLVPDAGALYTLPRTVGVQRAKELMLSARDVDGDEALRLGIAMELHAPDALLPRAQALARSVAAASPLAVSLIKRSLASSASAGLEAVLDIEANAQALAAGSQSHRDAVRAFLDKQPPAFRWPGVTG